MTKPTNEQGWENSLRRILTSDIFSVTGKYCLDVEEAHATLVKLLKPVIAQSSLEAVKEFSEELKKNAVESSNDWSNEEYVYVGDIDRLVKAWEENA